MIQFDCPGCGKRFDVPDHFAGRKAKCKACGNSVTVPTPAAETIAPPLPAPDDASAQPKVSVRTRRLLAEAEQMNAAFAKSNHIHIVSILGNPPETYRIDFNVRGLERATGAQTPTIREQHSIEIHLPADYPRLAPHCKILTPIFHPNFDRTTICVGDHWAAGERLVDLVIRIAEMIGYQAYNIKSPLDGEAAMWADLHHTEFPVDTRPMNPEV